MSHNLLKIYDAILPRSSWGVRSGVFESTILILQILVKMMLVTTVCYWLDNGDRFKTLVTDVGNQRITSPTSVTNVNVTKREEAYSPPDMMLVTSGWHFDWGQRTCYANNQNSKFRFISYIRYYRKMLNEISGGAFETKCRIPVHYELKNSV